MQLCNMLLWLVNLNWFESVSFSILLLLSLILLLLPIFNDIICTTVQNLFHSFTHSLFHSHRAILLSRRHEFVSPITLIRFEMVLSVYIQLSYVSIFASFGLRITNKIKFSTNSSTDVQHQKISSTQCYSVFSTFSSCKLYVCTCYSTNCVNLLDFICVTRFYSSDNIKRKYVR